MERHRPSHALWHINAKYSELQQVGPPQHSANLCRVIARYSLISTGTERLVCSGLVDESLQQAMAVPYMQGSFALPILYGYGMVGHTDDHKAVHLMHPHQNVAYVRVEDLFFLPDDADLARMALISNMETVINALWDVEYFFSDSSLISQSVAIVGFGCIGSLLATTLKKRSGVSAVIVETDDWRLRQAKDLGFEAINLNQTSRNFDLLFHTSSSETGLQYCIDHASLEGVIIELSWYGSRDLQLNLGAAFHYRRLRLISSQVSKIPKHKHQADHHGRKVLAAELLLDPIYDKLISHRMPFHHAAKFYAKLRNSSLEDGLIWLLEY